MRAFTLYFLLNVLALGANITDITCPDGLNDKGVFELTLHVDGDFNASFEQKDEGSVTTLIFKGLKTDKPFTKTFDGEMIKNVSIKPDTNAVKISFESKQLFDISVTNDADAARITITPKAALFAIENIAKDIGSGNIVSYILDMLFYVAILLFGAAIAVILFLYLKKANIIKKTEEKNPVADVLETTLEETKIPPLHEQQTKIKSKKKSSNIRQKTLFDM
ncbi:MAG: hypothetical protein LBF71_03650 [Campylobacteraceae bacterium]|nr:hypothetical protein [Campylobacteraceae bacterium]